MKQKIIAYDGSVQNIKEIPEDLRALYKTVWEIKSKVIIDMAADRGAFICQSQSMNIHMTDINFGKLTSMHFYAWKKGLKTGMYYLRSKSAADAIKFTVDQTILNEVKTEKEETEMVGKKRKQQEESVFETELLEQRRKKLSDDISCSLDNREGCDSCGS